jgi:hypothetical protein
MFRLLKADRLKQNHGMLKICLILELAAFGLPDVLRAQAPTKEADPFAASQTIDRKAAVPPRSKQPPDKYLKRFQEPDLAKPGRGMALPQIRLFLIPTFQKPLSIRGYMSKDGPQLRVVRLSGEGGYEWGGIELDKTIPLKIEVWKQLIKSMANPQVTQPLAGMTDDEINRLPALDGASWMLEVREKDRYFYSDVWSPHYINQLRGKPRVKGQVKVPDLTAFIQCCELLIQSARFKSE